MKRKIQSCPTCLLKICALRHRLCFNRPKIKIKLTLTSWSLILLKPFPGRIPKTPNYYKSNFIKEIITKMHLYCSLWLMQFVKQALRFLWMSWILQSKKLSSQTIVLIKQNEKEYFIVLLLMDTQKYLDSTINLWWEFTKKTHLFLQTKVRSDQ